MKKTFAILLALAMVFGLLAGCGGSDKEDTGTKKGETAPVKEAVVTVEPGKYQAIYCAVDGEAYDCDRDWLEIEADGVGVLVFEGEDYSMEWEYSNNLFTFEDEDGSSFVGSYVEGTIAGILDGEIEYVFEKESAGGKKPAAAQPAEPEKESGFEPVSATLGGYEVSVVGAELFTDADDKDAIRVYWDFTNTSDESTYAYCDLAVMMEQEGFELSSTYAHFEDDVPEYGNDTLDLRPGVSIRSISEYNCKADGEPISFTIYDWYDAEDALTVEFDPQNLPGRPAKDLEIEPISDPAWTEGMDVEGYVGEDSYVVIEGAEVVEGWDSGEEVIRVYFTYTNESDEASSFWWANSYRAFQDGVELTEDWAEVDVDEDEASSLEIQPGETVYCSVCWELRSDSPVEIEVYDWDENDLGIVFDLADLR